MVEAHTTSIGPSTDILTHPLAETTQKKKKPKNMNPKSRQRSQACKGQGNVTTTNLPNISSRQKGIAYHLTPELCILQKKTSTTSPVNPKLHQFHYHNHPLHHPPNLNHPAGQQQQHLHESQPHQTLSPKNLPSPCS